MLGWSELLVLGAVVIIFFSARKLPELFGSVGKSVKSFKSALKGEEDERPSREVNEIHPPPNKKS